MASDGRPPVSLALTPPAGMPPPQPAMLAPMWQYRTPVYTNPVLLTTPPPMPPTMATHPIVATLPEARK